MGCPNRVNNISWGSDRQKHIVIRFSSHVASSHSFVLTSLVCLFFGGEGEGEVWKSAFGV